MAKQQKAGGGHKARLEARLATLETRLQMLETAIGSEVERVHLAAEQMDRAVRALDERPATAVDLSPIDRRLDAIGYAIEGIAAQLPATVDLTPVHEHLEALRADAAAAYAGPSADPGADLAPLRDRLDLVAAGIADLTARSRDDQALTALIERIDALAQDLARRTSPATVDAPAAVVAALIDSTPESAGDGLARLDGRIDVEFDDVARQLDALGTLLQQTIEAVDRIESQITGAQPETDRMRSVARGTIETLRETSRQRIARRTTAPELNR